jgi:hypothetical protein
VAILLGVYYRPSGRVAPVPFAVTLVASLAFALFLALLYASIELELRKHEVVKTLMALGTGFGLGRAFAWALHGARVRSVRVARLAGGFVGAFFVYAAWVGWLPAFCSEPISSWELFLRPRAVVQGMQLVDLQGAWALADTTPVAPPLRWSWALEALVLLALPALLAARNLHGVFCERCQVWCRREPGAGRVSLGEGEEAVARLLEARTWSGLFDFPVSATDYLRLELDRCPTCGETNTLTAVRVTTAAKHGRTVRRVKARLDRRLLLSRPEVEALEQALRDEAARRLEQRSDKALSDLGQQLRDRANERVRIATAIKSELVPNEDGVVYGPTRAELIVAGINALAFAPFMGCPTAVVVGLTETLLGHGVFRGPQGEKIVFSIFGTLVVVSFLLPLYFLVTPRPVSRVRARVFEPGKRGPWVAIFLVAFYLVAFVASLVTMLIH